MLGADISTAKIAKGIYKFFGGKGDKEKEALATVEGKGPANPESIQKLTEKNGTENTQASISATQPSIDKLVQQVEKLALSLDPKNTVLPGRKNKTANEVPLIRTEFDDTTLTLMAHDRL